LPTKELTKTTNIFTNSLSLIIQKGGTIMAKAKPKIAAKQPANVNWKPARLSGISEELA